MICNATKTILSAALAGALVLSTALPAGAAAPTEKEEVVYAKLSHDGRVDSIYVVNSFDLPRAGTITDRGGYSEVRNLTTTDDIHLEGDAVSVSAPQGKFYYEGVLENRELPWTVSVEYRLDDKPISGDKLAGKSGRLQIDLRIHPNKNSDPVYTDNYAIQASLSLDGERCANIVAEDATVATVGKNKQLSYILLPGKDGDFTITADVENFEMDGISINGVPLSLRIDDPDTQELKDKIAELQDGAVELDDGAWELDDGASELYDGAVDLDDGATRLDDGVAELQDGVEELGDGVEELQDGADDLRDGAQELYNGTKDLKEGVETLESGVAQLSTGALTFGEGLALVAGQSGALTTGSAQVLQGLQHLEAGVSGLDEQSLGGMMEQASALQGGAQLYLDTLDALIAQCEAQLRQSLSLGLSSSDALLALQTTIAMLSELRDSYAQINDGLQLLTGAVLDQGESLPALADGIRELNGQYALLGSGLGLYTQGVGQLNTSYGELTGGLSDLTGGVDDLVDGVRDLRSGAKELYDGTYDLQDGVGKLADGVVDLRDGATELRDGTTELRDGTIELLDGVVELKDGTTELLDGTTELREKTADMDDEIDERIDEMLEEYRGADFEAVSFVDAGNRVRSVQFVMLTEGVTLEDTAAEAVAHSEPEPLTLWQRFRNLFAFA